MKIPARVNLHGGPCAGAAVTAVYRMNSGQSYAADLEFSNGQRVEGVPTYVPLGDGSHTARLVAERAGAAAASEGVLDIYALAHRGILPFAQLLFRLAGERQGELARHLSVPADSLSFSVSCFGQAGRPTGAKLIFSHNRRKVGGAWLLL